MALNKEQVLAALEGVASPTGTPLPRTGALSDVVAGDGKVFFSITVDAADVKAWESVRKRAEEAVRALPGVQSALVALTAERKGGAAPPRPQAQGRAMPARGAPRGEALQGVPGVAAIIAVASGKGGVGKSTTAVNLALGLSALGLKVGVLDADIYGPSLPKLLAIRERPQTIGGTRLKPITRYGLTVMSIGFLIDEETAMIWRGPMVISALTQMLRHRLLLGRDRRRRGQLCGEIADSPTARHEQSDCHEQHHSGGHDRRGNGSSRAGRRGLGWVWVALG